MCSFFAAANERLRKPDLLVQAWIGTQRIAGGEFPRKPSRIWLPDDSTERSGRADPPEGHAGDPNDRRGVRRVNACALG